MTSAIGATSLSDYQLRLPTFEGPLDVLLGLIEREKLEISDLSLTAVTDGFLAHKVALADATPSMLAEFAGVAARLLVLKSRALLPRPESVEPEPDIDDLAEQLREYQRAKRAAETFRSTTQAGIRTFGRPPVVMNATPRITLVPPPVADLRRAVLRSLSRVRAEPEVAAMRPAVTLVEMIDRLRGRLRRVVSSARFRELVGHGREETIVGFIALLALWRRGEVVVEQENLFSDIYVARSSSTLDADSHSRARRGGA